jgi:hypothetical protein
MNVNESPKDAKDVADIPLRPYLDSACAEKLRTAGNLILETGPNTSWAFPLAHLVRFDWTLRTIDNPWANSDKAPKIEVGSLRLQFTVATVTVDTSAPEKILGSILSRTTVVLRRGRARPTQLPGERPHIEYDHTIPAETPEAYHSEYTGIIKVTQ